MNLSNIMTYNEWLSLNESYLDGVNDDDIVAATLIGEAGGESDPRAMQAVYNVLRNRANKKGTTPAAEALRPRQFSMWDSATSYIDPKTKKRIGYDKKSQFDKEAIMNIINMHKKHSKWNKAMNIVRSNPKDITNGATHYYAHKKVKPYWADQLKDVIVIGNHTFGKLK